MELVIAACGVFGHRDLDRISAMPSVVATVSGESQSHNYSLQNLKKKVFQISSFSSGAAMQTHCLDSRGLFSVFDLFCLRCNHIPHYPHQHLNKSCARTHRLSPETDVVPESTGPAHLAPTGGREVLPLRSTNQESLRGVVCH